MILNVRPDEYKLIKDLAHLCTGFYHYAHITVADPVFVFDEERWFKGLVGILGAYTVLDLLSNGGAEVRVIPYGEKEIKRLEGGKPVKFSDLGSGPYDAGTLNTRRILSENKYDSRSRL
jgi:hypothetical protein